MITIAFSMNYKEASQILELNLSKPDITTNNVTEAFRKLSKRRHPNRGGSDKNFIELTEAKNYMLSFLKSGSPRQSGSPQPTSEKLMMLFGAIVIVVVYFTVF
jgi:hypothetical protein